jgi:hypothetical protein
MGARSKEEIKIQNVVSLHIMMCRGSKWEAFEVPDIVFKIEVFNALLGLSKCTSFKTTLQNATPKLKMKTSLEIPNTICMSQEPTSEGHCHYKQ